MQRTVLTIIAVFIVLTVSLFSVSCTKNDKKDVTIRFARWARVEDAQRFQVLIHQFEKDNPEISVKTEYLPWDAYWEKLSIVLQTGDAPDVFMMSSAMSSQFVSTAMPIQRLDQMDRHKLFQNYSTTILTPITKYGARYGMPIGLGLRVLFYNRDILKSAGIPYPSDTQSMNWEDFARMLETVQKKNAFVYPLRMNSEDLLECLLNAYQTPLFSDTVTQDTSSMVRPRALRAFEMMNLLYRKGLVPPSGSAVETGESGIVGDALVSPNAAFMYTGMWALPLLQKARINYGAIPLPQATTRASAAEINYLMMAADSAHKDAAWKMIEWFATKGQILIGTTGDYRAYTGYDPMTAARSSQSGLYRTLAEEKAYIVPSLRISNRNVQEEYTRCAEGIASGILEPEEAVSSLTSVLASEIGKGVVSE